MHESLVRNRIEEALQIKKTVFEDHALLGRISIIADAIIKAFEEGNKVLFCGNGGSAADAQHLAAELSGKYYKDRAPLYAEALHVNTSYLTATANDYDFNQVYARLVEGKGKQGDVLVALSTSGNSPNVVNALETAKKKGMITIGFSGKNNGAMEKFCDHMLKVPSGDTPRIQEAHMLFGHIICEIVEKQLFD